AHHNLRLTPAVRQSARIRPRTKCEVHQREAMILYDDTTAPHLDSAISVQSESEQSAASDAGSADRVDAPHPTQPAQDEKPQPMTTSTEDFASALETFTTEVEEQQAGEDRALKVTVLKLITTHVVIDIGAKSEGMLPLAEVFDHEGKPKVQPGDEIAVMPEKGET